MAKVEATDSLNRGLPFTLLDTAVYLVLWVWAMFDRKLRSNLTLFRMKAGN